MAKTPKKYRKRTTYILERIINDEARERLIDDWRNRRNNYDDYWREDMISVRAKTMKNALKKARKLGSGVEITIYRGGVNNISFLWYYNEWFWA